jgi:hypothetical protein
MANPTTVADLEARWRPLSAQEAINAEAFLGDAWEMLLSRRPNLEATIADGTVSAANAVRVVSAMVLRVLKNPDGWEDEAVDDWRGKRAAVIASGELYVSSTELADVTPGRANRKSVRLVAYGDA